jgi:hypothetical protein
MTNVLDQGCKYERTLFEKMIAKATEIAKRIEY